MLEYYTRSSYGRELLYIADPTQAQDIATLTGKKTVSRADLDILSRLMGTTSTEVLPPRGA